MGLCFFHIVLSNTCINKRSFRPFASFHPTHGIVHSFRIVLSGTSSTVHSLRIVSYGTCGTVHSFRIVTPRMHLYQPHVIAVTLTNLLVRVLDCKHVNCSHITHDKNKC